MKIFFSLLISLLYFNSFSQTIDAAVYYNSTYSYFFKENKAIKYNLMNDKVEKISTIQTEFPGVSFSSIDAAVNFDNGKIYFFSSGKYIRYDLNRNYVDEGYPKEINSSTWPGLDKNIQSAMNWPSKAYFFSDGEYTRYDKTNDYADEGYPKEINSTSWPGVDFNTIDAAFTLPSGKSYLFSGNNYIRYDITSDQADADYPRTINSTNWPGLPKALTSSQSNTNNNIITNNTNNQTNTTDYGTYSITKSSIDLSPYYVSSDSKMTICQHYTYKNPQGGVYLVIRQDFNTVIFNYDENFNQQAEPILIKNVEFSDMHISRDGTIAILVGKDINNTYIEGYSNTVAFIKIDRNGNIVKNINIYGGKGHEIGDSWFDGRSRARITCNGLEYGMYFEVQKYFENDKRVHNGDAFYVSDLNGKVKPNRTHFWTASHSQTVRTTCEMDGDFFTLTSGDSYPYGIQFFNRNTNKQEIIWPPIEDRITYEEVASASAAGVLKLFDYNNGTINAFLLTSEKPNYGDGRPLDPLFIKVDKQGNIINKKWIEVSPNVNDNKMSAQRIGKNYLIVWTERDSGKFKIAKLDPNGNFIGVPMKVKYPLGYNGFVVPISENEAVWFVGDSNGSTELDAYKIKFSD